MPEKLERVQKRIEHLPREEKEVASSSSNPTERNILSSLALKSNRTTSHCLSRSQSSPYCPTRSSMHPVIMTLGFDSDTGSHQAVEVCDRGQNNDPARRAEGCFHAVWNARRAADAGHLRGTAQKTRPHRPQVLRQGRPHCPLFCYAVSGTDYGGLWGYQTIGETSTGQLVQIGGRVDGFAMEKVEPRSWPSRSVCEWRSIHPECNALSYQKES